MIIITINEIIIIAIIIFIVIVVIYHCNFNYYNFNHFVLYVLLQFIFIFAGLKKYRKNDISIIYRIMISCFFNVSLMNSMISYFSSIILNDNILISILDMLCISHKAYKILLEIVNQNC